MNNRELFDIAVKDQSSKNYDQFICWVHIYPISLTSPVKCDMDKESLDVFYENHKHLYFYYSPDNCPNFRNYKV